MKRRSIVCGLSVLTLVAACGSSSKSSTSSSSATTASPATSTGPASSPPPASTSWNLSATNSQLLSIIGSYPKLTGNTTQGVTATKITAGCIADATAAGAPTQQQDFCKGVEARIDQANANKDVSQSIDLTSSLDTGSDPTQGQQDLAQLVDSDKVGVVFDFSSAASTATLEAKHIPYFGTWSSCGVQSVAGFSPGEGVVTCEALLSESKDKDYSYTTGILAALTKYTSLPVSQLRYAAVASNVGPLVEFADAIGSEYSAAGMKVVDLETKLPASSAQAVDLSPYVQNVLAAKPNVIGMIFEDTALLTRMTGALFQAGYKGAILGVYSPSMLQNPTVAQEINGALDTTSGWGDPSFGGADWAVLNQEAKNLNVSDDYGFLQGWISADLYIQGLQAFEKTGQTLTEENLINFMNNNWTYPGYGDVTAPTIFPYGKYGPPPCSALTQMNAAKKIGVGVVDVSCGVVDFKSL